LARSNGGESNFMAERQSSPGEVTARPEPDMTHNGSEGAGAHGGTQARPDAAAPADDARGADATGGSRLTPGANEAFTATRTVMEQPTTTVRPSPTPHTSGTTRPSPGPTPTQAPAVGRPSAVAASAGEQVVSTPADRQPGERPSPFPAARPVTAAFTEESRASPRPAGAVEPSADDAADDEQPTVPTPKGAADGTGADSPTTTVRVPNGELRTSWFTPAAEEQTQVLPRMPAAPGPAAPAEPITERIPITTVAAAPPVPPVRTPDEPGHPDDPQGPRKRSRRRPLLIVASVIGVLALLYVGDLLLGLGSMPRGVTVAGVAVGGMSVSDAEQQLHAEIEPRISRPIPVTVGEARGEIDPASAGLAVDWAATLQRAGEQPLNPITRITSFFTDREVGVVTARDDAALSAAMQELAPVVDRAPTEGTVRFEGVRPIPVDPQPGQQLDIPAAMQVMEREWTTGREVALPLVTLAPSTTPEDVVTALDEIARPAVSAPVTLIGEKGVRGTITPEVIASALLFRAEGGALVPELNQAVLEEALDPQMAPSEKPGRDATLDFSSGSPVVVPSQDGRGVDYQATLTNLIGVLTGNGPREIIAVYGDQPAELTTEELKGLGITGVIGEFTTGGFAADSGRNIKRAAEQINGTVVQPGETFSLNAATAPRNAANGYVEAGIINDGHPDRGIGGGVSQVATTLYNAAYFAGMVDVEHKEHSFYIGRYPAGREATVFEGAIDLKFRNDNPTGVMIQTVWTPTSLTVRLYGTKRYEVTSTPGPRTNPTQPKTVTIPEGRPCSPSNGAPGFTITDTRTLRDISTGEVRTERRTVRYNPSPIVVCEG
jgi:vancomycin resistance protein YoaR